MTSGYRERHINYKENAALLQIRVENLERDLETAHAVQQNMGDFIGAVITEYADGTATVPAAALTSYTLERFATPESITVIARKK